jgi:hypothetical protein
LIRKCPPESMWIWRFNTISATEADLKFRITFQAGGSDNTQCGETLDETAPLPEERSTQPNPPTNEGFPHFTTYTNGPSIGLYWICLAVSSQTLKMLPPVSSSRFSSSTVFIIYPPFSGYISRAMDGLTPRRTSRPSPKFDQKTTCW